MSNWNEIVDNYIVKFSDKIKKTTEPIRDHFGIGYFNYHRIDETGKYHTLVDSPEFAEDYVNKKIFIDDPYLRHPSNYRAGICLMDNYGSEKYQKNVRRSMADVLQVNTGVVLIEKSENSVEFFGFVANKGNANLKKLYLNHPHLLKLFAVHFKNEMNTVLSTMWEQGYSLVELKGQDFFSKASFCPELDVELRIAYYKDLGLNYALDKAAKLSARERECVQLLVEGKSAKESAVHLGLSVRTVEFYFVNIKNKLACWNKQQVFAIGKTLQEVGLL